MNAERQYAKCSWDDLYQGIEVMLEALKITAGNIRSLGPAGAIPGPYTVWLEVVESAIAKVEGRT